MKRNNLMKAFAVALAITLAVPTVASNSFAMQVEAASDSQYESALAQSELLLEEVVQVKELADSLVEEARTNPAKAVENYEVISAEWDRLYAELMDNYNLINDYKNAYETDYPEHPVSDKKSGTQNVREPEFLDEEEFGNLFVDYKVAKEDYLANPTEEKLEEIATILADYATRRSCALDFVGKMQKSYADGFLFVEGTTRIGNTDRRAFSITGTSLDSLKLNMYGSLFTKSGTDYSYVIGDDYVQNMSSNATYQLTSKPVYNGKNKVHVEFKDGLFSKSIDMDAYDIDYVDMTAKSFEAGEQYVNNRLLYNQMVYNYNLASMNFTMLHNDYVELKRISNEYNESALPETAKKDVAKAKEACESNPTEDNFVELAKAMIKSMCYENTAIDFSTVEFASVNKDYNTICVVYQMKSDSPKTSYPITKFYRYSTDLNQLELTETQVQYASKDGKIQYVLGGTSVFANYGKSLHNVVSTSVNADQSITITYKQFWSTKKVVVYPVKENTYVFSRINTYQVSHKPLESCTHTDPINDGKVLVFLNGGFTCTYLDENGKTQTFSSGIVEKSTVKNDVKEFTYKEGNISYTIKATALFHSSTPSTYSVEEALN